VRCELTNKNVRDTFKKKKRSEKNVLIPQLRGLRGVFVSARHMTSGIQHSPITQTIWLSGWRLYALKLGSIDANILFVEAIFI